MSNEFLVDTQAIIEKIVQLFPNNSIDDNVKREKATLLASRIPNDKLSDCLNKPELSNDEKLTELKRLFNTTTKDAIARNQQKQVLTRRKAVGYSAFASLYMALGIVGAVVATTVLSAASAGAGVAVVGVATVVAGIYAYYRNKSLVAKNKNLQAEIEFINDDVNELKKEETDKMALMRKDFANFKGWVSSFCSRRETPTNSVTGYGAQSCVPNNKECCH